MALEAMGPVAEQKQRHRLGLADQREHALRLGVDVSLNNWKEVLLGWVRRDVLCRGGKVTYDAARKASDGFEHGYMHLPAYRAVATEYGRTLLDYVRAGLLDLLDLPETVRSELASKRPLDVTPFWHEIKGELHGEVKDPDRMGESGQLYPYADWHTTLQDVRPLPNGHLTVSPTMTLTAHLSKGVQITYFSHRIGVGLSDVDLFDYQPPPTEEQS